MKIKIKLTESKNNQQLYDLEKVHFGGDLRDIAESLKFLIDNYKDKYGEIDTYEINEILKDAGKSDIRFVGEGSFRITFKYGEDIIKIAKTNTAKIMNEQDTELGRNNKYALLFPKVYMVDEPNYDWIVMEKCDVITNSDTFLRYFPNPIIEEFFGNIHKQKQLRVFQLLLDYKANLIMDEDTNLYDARDKLQFYVNHNHANARDKLQFHVNLNHARNYRTHAGMFDSLRLTDGMIQRILKNYNKTFHLLAEMVAEFKIDPEEIRPSNTGTAPDGRFVVIDSSIGSTISKGLRSAP